MSRRARAVPQPNTRRALDLVMEMMAIAGPSCQEQQIADYVCQRLARAGAPPPTSDSAHRRTPTPGAVGNLILRLPGTRRAPRRLMSAHLDTVPLCVGSQPVRRGDVIRSAAATALGADNRAGCAVLLSAALEILERGLDHPPLTFCWFVQEEIGLQGSRLVSKSLLGKPRLAFNWDGGSPDKLTVGATGGIRMQIEIEGLASHAGGAPERGVSAIAIASIAIADLHRQGWHGDVVLDGRHGTSNVGVIRGGDATNVVTEHVLVKAEARSHDPRFRQQIAKRIERAFQDAAREVVSSQRRRGRIRVNSRLDYESFLLPADEPCVLAAERAVRAVGLKPQRAVANGGVDANWTTRHGIPTVTLGCGQRHQHTLAEQLSVRQFTDACRIGLRLALGAEGEPTGD